MTYSSTNLLYVILSWYILINRDSDCGIMSLDKVVIYILYLCYVWILDGTSIISYIVNLENSWFLLWVFDKEVSDMILSLIGGERLLSIDLFSVSLLMVGIFDNFIRFLLEQLISYWTCYISSWQYIFWSLMIIDQ